MSSAGPNPNRPRSRIPWFRTQRKHWQWAHLRDTAIRSPWLLSSLLVVLAGTKTGVALTLTHGPALQRFGAAPWVAGTVILALTRENGPMIIGFTVIGCIAVAVHASVHNLPGPELPNTTIATRIGMLRRTLFPRVLAAVAIMPLLYVAYVVAGVVGAYVVAVACFEVEHAAFVDRAYQITDLSDWTQGLLRMVVCGTVILPFFGRKSFYATIGTRGAHPATLRTIVLSALLVITADTSTLFIATYPSATP